MYNITYYVYMYALTNAGVAIHNVSIATITPVAARSVDTCLLARTTPALINIYNL